MNPAHIFINVCVDDFEITGKFETGSLRVKNYVTRPDQRKTLLTLQRSHV